MTSETVVVRSDTNPIIHGGLEGLEGEKGANINGPSLIRVPDWVREPLGRYYLYFAHHSGTSIRLAYSDSLKGPYTLYRPGVLDLETTDCLGHVASPDAHIDEEREEFRIFFHGPARGPGEADGIRQLTFAAVSSDGLSFRPNSGALGPFYFRAFRLGEKWYAFAKNRNLCGLLLESDGWCSPYRLVKEVFPRLRHAAVIIEDEYLYVFYSRIGDRPERILASRIRLDSRWKETEFEGPVEVVRPETEYEGASLDLEKSEAGAVYGRVNQLRDPALYREGEDLYLLYSCAGESGICIGRLNTKLEGLFDQERSMGKDDREKR